WFFLMVCEAFTLSGNEYSLPGIGAYMREAVDKNDNTAKAWAIVAMVLMIVLLDQLLWRPVVVWAQKFRVEEGGHQEAMSSWFLNWLRRSHLLAAAGRVFRLWQIEWESRRGKRRSAMETRSDTTAWASKASMIAF